MHDMTTRWLRILTAPGVGGTALDTAAAQLAAISAGPAPAPRARFGRQRAAAAAAQPDAVTVLCRQLIAGVLISDLLIDQLAATSGRSREQIMGQLSGELPQQLGDQRLSALAAELSDACALLRRDPAPASYSGLGDRVQQLLRLAEQQAAEIVAEARAEADRITAAARDQEGGGSAPEPASSA